MSVYFRFQGDRSIHVDDVNVAIDRVALETVEDSVLCKLASDMWKSSESAGSTVDNPIITKPLEGPCKEVWTPVLAHLILDAYKWHQDRLKWEADNKARANVEDDDEEAEQVKPQEPRVKLPEKIEFEDALLVLDYYGVMKDEFDSFDFAKTSNDIHIRALLYRKWLDKVQEAKQLILKTIKKDPKVKTLFLAASSKYDMEFINSPERNGKEKFVRIGDENECDSHFEWVVHHKKLRNYLVSLLEEQSGLETYWSTENYVFGDYCNDDHFRPGPSKCLLLVRPDVYNDYDGIDDMYVLEVKVPLATKRQRIA